MRRFVWLLGLLVMLVLGVVGVIWWGARDVIRLEPLDAQRFAQMRETEQVEWLIEQILARSRRTDLLATIASELSLSPAAERLPLDSREIEAIGMACVEYDLPHWLNAARRYVRAAEREHLTVYQAILQARRGDWQAAEQTVRQIQTDAFKALALAHLMRLQAEAGQSEAAQQSLNQLRAILTRPADSKHSYYQTMALLLIINHSSIPERPEAAAAFVQSLHRDWHMAAIRWMLEYYRQRGDVEGLRAFAALIPKHNRRETEMYLVRTLIEQGKVEEGLRLLGRIGKCRDIELAQIARALHKQGRIQDARTFADALRTRLLQDGFPLNLGQLELSRRVPDTLRLPTPYGEVQVKIQLDYYTARLLVQAYTEWGLPEAAEQLIAAVPHDHFQVRAQMNMVYTCHKMGQQAQARQHLERARAAVRKPTRRVPHGRPVIIGTSAEVGCTAAECGEFALALEVANSAALFEQKDILSCILRAYAFRRNAFWERLVAPRGSDTVVAP